MLIFLKVIKGKLIVSMFESILKDANSRHHFGEQVLQALIRFCSISVQYTPAKAFLVTEPLLY